MIRVRGLAPVAAAQVLSTAEDLVRGGSHDVRHASALEITCRYGVSACDARFLAVAGSLDARLVTEDAKLRRAAPQLTMSLVEAIPDA